MKEIPTPLTNNIMSKGTGTIPLISELEDHARQLERDRAELIEALRDLVYMVDPPFPAKYWQGKALLERMK